MRKALAPSTKPIPTVWFRHLPDEEQEDFKETLKSSFRVLDRMRAIVKDLEAQVEKLEGDPSTYDAGYAYKQAHLNGLKKAYQNVLQTLSFLEE